MSHAINVHVRLDPAMFRRYCAFDTFRRQRRWYAPVLTGMVLATASAGLLLARQTTFAGVLLGLGIAVPMVVFGLYLIQIEANIAAQSLKNRPAVYSLRISPEGVKVTNDQKKEPPVELAWSQLWAAFRRKDAIYLYVTPERAFILPDGQADASPEALWQYLEQHLGRQKCIR